MTTLLDARGKPMQSYAKPRVIEPIIEKGFGQWAGRDTFMARLPGGGLLQFDLNKLTLADFRSMRSHYQLGASLNVLTFVMHQIDWRIDCENQEIKDFLEADLREHWTRLIFSLSQSFWAGYSPNAINYENRDGYIRLKQIKDLVPEECNINWKVENGWAPYNKPKPKLYSFDGVMQNGHEIPTQNAFWYPLLMENGDHWGRKLLKPAFPAWFFSNLIHMYANRYFERFGEPLPVGRAPFEDEVDVGGNQTVKGKQVMEGIVTQIRNRAAVVLPSDVNPDSQKYEYDIEYLESQMRGADFERYLSRLDEEMSLSVFTPILLFRTADVGSYNLGQAHLKIFEQMLNAIAGDAQFYIQRYLVDRMRVLNFGQDSPRASWSYRRLGTVDLAVYKEIVVELVRQGAAKLDMEELGNIIGVSMEEQEILTADPAAPQQDPSTQSNNRKNMTNARATLHEATSRAVRELLKGNESVTFGFRNKFVEALQKDGFDPQDASQRADAIYARVNQWLDNVGGVFADPVECKSILERVIDLDS
jgi:hypothetical protein